MNSPLRTIANTQFERSTRDHNIGAQSDRVRDDQMQSHATTRHMRPRQGDVTNPHKSKTRHSIVPRFYNIDVRLKSVAAVVELADVMLRVELDTEIRDQT
jgi:hypothetical protein